MKDVRLYLIDILERIERIETYTAAGRDAFLADARTQDAVIRCFEIIGEAAKGVDDGTRQLAPEIPWRRVAGFRDILIHQYAGVDPNEVWRAVAGDLPSLKASFAALLQALEGPEPT